MVAAWKFALLARVGHPASSVQIRKTTQLNVRNDQHAAGNSHHVLGYCDGEVCEMRPGDKIMADSVTQKCPYKGTGDADNCSS